MIPALHAYGWECHLVEPADLKNAVIGISSELLAGLSPAEIVARMGPSAARKFVVVFDGPGRTTPSKLDDGLLRRRVQRALIEADVPFVVAPALAAAQLAYLHGQNLISHVSGSDEAWLWADVPIVLDIFAVQPQMLRRSAVLSQLRLHEDSFIELLTGIGNNAVTKDVFPPLANAAPPTLDAALRSALQLGGPPPLTSPGPGDFGLSRPNSAAADPISALGSGPLPGSGSLPGYGALPGSLPDTDDSGREKPQPAVSMYRAALAISDTPYLASLQRSLTYIYRQPVLELDGTVHLHNLMHKQLPKDLTEVVGCQISPVLHFYLTQGVLGPELIQGMLWATFSDPVTAVIARREASEPQLSQQFRSLQTALSPIRQQAYAILVSTAHRYFQMKEVVVKIPGASNFSKVVQAKFPVLTGDATSATPQTITNDAMNKLQEITDMAGVSTLDMPQTFTQRHVLGSTKTPPTVLVQQTTLVFREYIEVCVFWLLVSKIGTGMDLKKLVLALPFQ